MAKICQPKVVMVIALLILLLFVSVIPLSLAFCLKKRFKKTKLILFALAGLLIFTQTGIWLYDFSGMQAHNHYLQLKAFLNQPFPGLSKIGLSRGKAIIALSYMTEGLVNYTIQKPAQQKEVIPLIEKAIEIAFNPDISPYQDIKKVSDWGEEGLYLSHLNVILGYYQRLTSDRKYFHLNQTISQYLAQKILSEPYHNIRSYNKAKNRWPADNAVTLYSLYLFDQNNHTQTSQLPISKWLKYMETKGTEPTTKLHYSELTGIEKYSPYPRGCALSWTIKYISDFAPEAAKELWHNYKQHFQKNFLIISGFREYPEQINFAPDIDSGPIIIGIGAGATGLALNAAKSMGDYLTYYQINNAVRFVDLMANLLSYFGQKKWHKLSQDILATSIRFNAETKE